jgi:hypothetical protein
LCLTSIFGHQKLEAKHKWKLIRPLLELPRSKLGSFKRGQWSFFYLGQAFSLKLQTNLHIKNSWNSKNWNLERELFKISRCWIDCVSSTSYKKNTTNIYVTI